MLTQDLAVLETRGLVRVTTDQAKPVVRFKHALTREATYNSILQSRRTELHCVVARVLAEAHQQLDLELVLSIAEHQLYCRDDASMVEFLLPFTQRLIYTGRSPSLTQLLSQVDRSALTETQRRDVDMALADAHAARGEYEAARGLYERALTQTADHATRAQVLYKLGVAAYHLNQNENAIAYQRACIGLAIQAQDLKLQARACGGLGLAYWNRGDYARAEENLLTSRTLGLKIGEGIELANAEYNLAGMKMDRGHYTEGLEHAETALGQYEKLGHTTQIARTRQIIGACYYGIKDFESAAEQYRRAIQMSRQLGDNLYMALGLGNLAEVYETWEKLDQSVGSYTEAIGQLRLLKYDLLLAYYLASLASVQIRQALTVSRGSDFAQAQLQFAESNVTEALDIAVRIRSAEDEGVARRVYAELCAARGDWANAITSARQAVILLEPLGRALELERAVRVENEILSAAQRD